MFIPLVFLALLSCLTGWIPFSHFISSDSVPYDLGINWWIAAGGILVSLIGIIMATRLYRRGTYSFQVGRLLECCRAQVLYRPGMVVRYQKNHFPLHKHTDSLVRQACDRRCNKRPRYRHGETFRRHKRHTVRSHTDLCGRICMGCDNNRSVCIYILMGL